MASTNRSYLSLYFFLSFNSLVVVLDWVMEPHLVKPVFELVDVLCFYNMFRQLVPNLAGALEEEIRLNSVLSIFGLRQVQLESMFSTWKTVLWLERGRQCGPIVLVEVFIHLDDVPSSSPVHECWQVETFQSFWVVEFG